VDVTMAVDELNGLLARALTAFERREDEAALGLLVEAWRTSRSERIAALVQRLSDRLNLTQSPYGPLSNSFSAGRPLLTRYPQVLDWLRTVANEGDPEALARQLGYALRWPEDPRLLPVLRTLARWPVARHDEVQTVLRDLFLHLKAPGTEDDLQALQRALNLGTSYAEELARLPGRKDVPRDVAEAGAACDAMEQALAHREEAEVQGRSLRDTLLARVYAEPDDEGARLVLADHLQEQGDPLGEFIMLQCAAPTDEARLRELLEQHARTWLGPLGPLIHPESTRFERGFPVSVRLNLLRPQDWPPPGPAWGTVREIHAETAMHRWVSGWLAHPHLHAVTVLRGIHPNSVPHLGAYPLPVRHLELSGEYPIEEEAFLKLSTLPHLTSVEVTDATFREVGLCASSPLAGSLKRFTATQRGAWTLEATPSEAVTVTATLLDGAHGPALAQAVRAAQGFGTRALHVSCPAGLARESRQPLEAVASLYARVEWSSR
jgi:uncharacterized protein (TIGR02996 family)